MACDVGDDSGREVSSTLTLDNAHVPTEWSGGAHLKLFSSFYGFQLKQCVLQILRFTSLLIEHSFSRTVYNSMDYLTELLYSSDLTLLLENLHLLFMFSKRSNLLTRLPDDKRGLLLEGLYALAEVMD